MLLFSTGLSFQVPVIQLLLGQSGIVSSIQMLSIWKYVVTLFRLHGLIGSSA